MDYCAFLVLGLSSPCDHSCIVCATLWLTVMPSLSNITDISTIDHSLKTDSRRTPLFHVLQYGDDIICQELNLDENCPVGKEVETTTFQTATTDVNKD